MSATHQRTVDSAYNDEQLVTLYDSLISWGPMRKFYFDLVMRAASVLDVGCGTGELLCRARQEGHTGDLTGVDPSAAMLALARKKRDDVTWHQVSAEELDLGRSFELITMMGHAFQHLLDDDTTRVALERFNRHLVPGGQLVFETRNPAARAWETWTSEARSSVRSPSGDDFEIYYEFRGWRDPDLADYVGVHHSRAEGEIVTHGTLRFIDPERMRSLLAEAGFRIDGWFGDWDRSDVTATSPEIIVIAATPSGLR